VAENQANSRNSWLERREAASSMPVVASHTAVRAISGHACFLPDDVLRAIVARCEASVDGAVDEPSGAGWNGRLKAAGMSVACRFRGIGIQTRYLALEPRALVG
jgi:hypothetical protein